MANAKGTPKNLKPFNKMDKEVREEIQRKGRKASADARKKRLELKEELLTLLSQGKTQEKMSLALIKKALNGDVKAFEVIRDTIGEKPTDKSEVKVIDTEWFVDE